MVAMLFYVDTLPDTGAVAVVDGDEGFHAATVRRIRPGEQLVLGDGVGRWPSVWWSRPTGTAVRAFMQAAIGPGQEGLDQYGSIPLPKSFPPPATPPAR